MGIPSYFSYIIKNYSNIIRSFEYFSANKCKFQHLYMDCNSILYDVFRDIEQTADCKIDDEMLERNIIENTICKIFDYIHLINPTKTIIIAFDGVAPYAKMEQQRNRRYKNSVLNSLTPSTQNDKSKFINWSTANITPGTEFMNKLTIALKHNKQKFKLLAQNVFISTSDEPGEGEHKMFEYIRTQSNISQDNAAVYGLDSDLIMLSIFHCSLFNNIYIFRETPEFLKSSIPVEATPNESNTNNFVNNCHFMDISKLSNSILQEMQCNNYDTHRIYDYIFLCFFLGNDFLPHFPAFNLRTNGMNFLLDAYKITIGNFQNRFLISKNMEIDWKSVLTFLKYCAKFEHSNLLADYEVRNKSSNRKWLWNTDNDRDYTFQNIPFEKSFGEKISKI